MSSESSTLGKPTFADVEFKPDLSRRQQKRALFQKRDRDRQGYKNDTPFRQVERQYRVRIPPPDLSQVLDFSNLENNSIEYQQRIVPITLNTDWFTAVQDAPDLFGVHAKCADIPRTGYMVKDFPGFIFIPNPFTPQAQRQWVKRCLREYAMPPAKSNLEALYRMPSAGVWNLYEQGERNQWPAGDTRRGVSKLSREDNTSAKTATAATSSSNMNEEDPPAYQVTTDTQLSSGDSMVDAAQLVPKLRWVTLGYQYNWSIKEYFWDSPLPFPGPVARLAQTVVQGIHDVGYRYADEQNFTSSTSADPTADPDKKVQPQYTVLPCETSSTKAQDQGYIHRYDPHLFQAEAGVVNFYQNRDSLMGHQDRSERNMTAPLVSVSLGNTAIFVIGEETKDVLPLAIYLRSGDIVCMCGPRRRAFHGVPRILEDTLPSYLAPTEEVITEDPDWALFGEYMTSTRLNINVRQVRMDDFQLQYLTVAPVQESSTVGKASQVTCRTLSTGSFSRESRPAANFLLPSNDQLARWEYVATVLFNEVGIFHSTTEQGAYDLGAENPA
ncbi:hypothetical protein IWQ62_003467, partial [Dispira parvispora]